MADLRRIVASLYEAFQRGDVGYIVTQLAPDVQWEHWSNNAGQRAGVPWL